MRKVYDTLDLTEAVLLKDHLLRNGIVADVRNKGAVRIPHDGIASEVWVSDDADPEGVLRLVREFLKRKEAPAARKSSWRCRRCREENPGVFELCWNCGEISATEPAL